MYIKYLLAITLVLYDTQKKRFNHFSTCIFHGGCVLRICVHTFVDYMCHRSEVNMHYNIIISKLDFRGIVFMMPLGALGSKYLCQPLTSHDTL